MLQLLHQLRVMLLVLRVELPEVLQLLLLLGGETRLGLLLLLLLLLLARGGGLALGIATPASAKAHRTQSVSALRTTS